MGIITEISRQKNKKRVNIFVDGEFISGISFEAAAKHGLNTGNYIDNNKLIAIIEESESQSAFTTGLDIIARSPKTKSEIIKKLIKKGFTSSVIDKAISKMEEYNYIDDLSYAKSFVKSYTSKSKKEIEYKLKTKGVSEEYIKQVTSELDDEYEGQNALLFARKYMRGKEYNEKTKNNLFAGLVRKGYSLDTIYTVIDQIKREIN